MTDLNRVATRENFAQQRAEIMFAKLRTTLSRSPVQSADDLADLRQRVRNRLLGQASRRQS
ncbi:MAG: hypothetical protein EOP22_14910 [Hyphomicrobiales bacterium]|nr:MAG: hypothetical protein EOP22_14910 [Hyphomicrobiales bacterium]